MGVGRGVRGGLKGIRVLSISINFRVRVRLCCRGTGPLLEILILNYYIFGFVY